VSLALLDCPTGLAGNMLLAALLDLGLPEAVIHAPLAALGLTGRYRLQIEERRSGGLRGLHLAVEPLESEPPHRSWGDLRTLLSGAALPPDLRERVLAVFGLLAEAEAAVHGHAPEQVHFHEVGAIDALVDVVGVCAGLRHFGVTRLVCGLPPAGHGSVSTAHGSLPLPAPAALPLQIGVGLGSRCLDRPNLLRLTLARELAAVPPLQQQGGGDATAGPEHGEREEPLLVQQAQIDDATAEDLAFLATALRQAGAVEVFSQAIGMKKGRQGTLLTALLPPALGRELRQVWWRHGTTLGVREQLQQRWILPRDACHLDTALGPVRLKRSHLPDGRVRLKPEHDDLADLARRHDLSLEQVRAEVRQRIETGGAIEAPSGEEP
jgi:pyridinium-3,5-bisthiocarboxylic acid mononucleotide nickel chelatase